MIPVTVPQAGANSFCPSTSIELMDPKQVPCIFMVDPKGADHDLRFGHDPAGPPGRTGGCGRCRRQERTRALRGMAGRLAGPEAVLGTHYALSRGGHHHLMRVDRFA